MNIQHQKQISSYKLEVSSQFNFRKQAKGIKRELVDNSQIERSGQTHTGEEHKSVSTKRDLYGAQPEPGCAVGRFTQ